MKIDRSDYEIWFIDFLDGNLNEEQVQQLEKFLILNPDLREELEDLRREKIEPPEVFFEPKRSLFRKTSQLTDDQFDLLCAAYIEKDLDNETLKEFETIVSGDPVRMRTLELFRKTRLNPPYIKFKEKGKLIRLTTLQKTMRIAAYSLGAAASVAMLVFLVNTSSNERNINTESLSLANEGNEVIELQTPAKLAENQEIIPDGNKKSLSSANKTSTVNKITAAASENPDAGNIIAAFSAAKNEEYNIIRADIPAALNIQGIAPELNLNEDLVKNSFSLAVIEPDENTVAGFVAKTFRKKILGEEKADDSPIKGYEIAEAGVNGINKLFGWQMALEKNSNEKGEIRSVSFSSKLLKVQAPVNRHESSE